MRLQMYFSKWSACFKCKCSICMLKQCIFRRGKGHYLSQEPDIHHILYPEEMKHAVNCFLNSFPISNLTTALQRNSDEKRLFKHPIIGFYR